ncbi:MAG: TrbI/VirB10 family protein [Candidatus Fusobacterium pullicola]|uniref:TrbI/VirB10 family protein n=1 Tax=Candidatus Fusobacterium pullicola TaxID=2838601 RepID=A0A9E2L0S4_9FUSO|nr:TrbI/VirB10 family protein [Candidatus Fusobacterium pullicola]
MKLKENIKKAIPKGEGREVNYKNIFGLILIILFLIFSSIYIKGCGKEEKKEKVDNNLQQMNAGKNNIIEYLTAKDKEEITNEGNPVLETIKIEEEKEVENIVETNYVDELMMERLRIEQARKTTPLSPILSRGNTRTSNNNDSLSLTFPDLVIPPYPDMEGDPNYQKKKAEFLKNASINDFVLQKPLTAPISPFEVKAGTIIPITLVTGIVTDNPGDVLGYVQNDVYDTATGRVLLIPAGSIVMGKYNSNVSFGQDRAQAVFNRITLPNMKSIDIGAMNATDRMGQSGLKDKVDARLADVFMSVLMSAILGAGTAVVTEDKDDGWKTSAGQGAGEQAINVGNIYATKTLNVQPKIWIRPSVTAGLFVSKDIILEPYED